jgi:hypothetical protein
MALVSRMYHRHSCCIPTLNTQTHTMKSDAACGRFAWRCFAWRCFARRGAGPDPKNQAPGTEVGRVLTDGPAQLRTVAGSREIVDW